MHYYYMAVNNVGLKFKMSFLYNAGISIYNVISIIKNISSQRAIPVPGGMHIRPTGSKAMD